MVTEHGLINSNLKQWSDLDFNFIRDILCEFAAKMIANEEMTYEDVQDRNGYNNDDGWTLAKIDVSRLPSVIRQSVSEIVLPSTMIAVFVCDYFIQAVSMSNCHHICHVINFLTWQTVQTDKLH